MSLKQIVVWGAAGHAAVVCSALRAQGCWDIVGLVDDVNSTARTCKAAGADVLGSSDLLKSHEISDVDDVIVAIGDNKARVKHAELAITWGYRLATAIHPRAFVDPGATIGAGTVVVAGAVVNPGVRIGTNVIVNTMASIDHECEIEDGAHIGPGAHLGGLVHVGALTWIGIGAVVRDRIRIGKNSIVGAGSVVVKNIPPSCVAYGVPAQPVRDISP